MKRLAWLLPLFILSATPTSVMAEGKRSGGTLAGKVTVTAPKRKPSGNTNYYNRDSNPEIAHPLDEEIILYLKKVPGKFAAPKKHVQLDQKYLQFTHRVIPVLKGTVVDFTNQDPVYHNVFTNSQINKFDLGRKGKGETASAKMKSSEVPVKVYCEIHASMKSYILVLDNPFFTTVGPGQEFQISGIPPGTYTLVAWHDHWEPVEQKVKVSKGKTTRADVTLDKAQN